MHREMILNSRINTIRSFNASALINVKLINHYGSFNEEPIRVRY